MKKARPFPYEKLKKMIKEQYPDIYKGLSLDLYNPYQENTFMIHTGENQRL